MKSAQRLTAIIEREDDGFVAFCPELDIASEGISIEEARTNLIEALTLFFETASAWEIARRSHKRSFCDTGRGTGWVESEFFPARRYVGFSKHDNRSYSAFDPVRRGTFLAVRSLRLFSFCRGSQELWAAKCTHDCRELVLSAGKPYIGVPKGCIGYHVRGIIWAVRYSPAITEG